MTPDLYSVIVPVYNEKTNIEPTADKIIDIFKKNQINVEILFVDDNSPDGTAEEVSRISIKENSVRLVQHGKKEGIGAAHKAGYEAAEGEFIMCIDADLSQSPKDLIRMKEKLDEGYDLIIGSRYMSKGRQIGKSLLRDFGSRGMNFICRFILGIPLTDCTHTFRAFKKELFSEFSSRLLSKGHPSFQVQFSFWISHTRKRIIEIPIKFIEREAGRGKSKISIRKELPSFIIVILKLILTRLSLGKKWDKS